MRKLNVAFFVGLLTMCTLAFNKPTAPPAVNFYMAVLQKSDMYRNQLQENLTESCLIIIDNNANSSSTESVYRTKFAKDVLIGGNALTFLVNSLTKVANHTSISEPETGFANCRNDFDNNLDRYVKSFYGVQY